MPIQRAPSAFAVTGEFDTDTSGLQLIYKHSPACGYSRGALMAVSKFAEVHPETEVTLVDVIEQRAASTRLAADLRVPHASPQVIFVRDSRAEWSASHGRISVMNLERAFADLTQSVVPDRRAGVKIGIGGRIRLVFQTAFGAIMEKP